MSKFITPKKSSSPAHVGDVRKGKTTMRFAALAALDSESDSEPEAPVDLVAFCRSMTTGVRWGDMFAAEQSAEMLAYAEALEEELAAGRLAAAAREEERAGREKDAALWPEREIWYQAFSTKLEARRSDCYDLANMSESDYEALMTWLYAGGWNIDFESREIVVAWPDDLPSRTWVSPRFTAKPKAQKSTGCVPRFCRTAACADASCRYVHGATMPRLNEPCAFGASCGASDPAKRALCIRMHPGETWTADLVVTRP